jgi:membrane protein
VLNKIYNFINKEIWHVKLANLPKWKAFGIRFLRILLLTLRGFTKSQIQQGASALTYYSLLAIVPVLALLIGVARAFLFEHTLETWLIEHFREQQAMLREIFKFANTSLEHAHGGLIAGAGVAILVWSSIKILMYIERAMNQIWEVKKGRVLARQFTDYLAMAFLAPVIILIASGLVGYLSALLQVIHNKTLLAPFVTVLAYALSAISFLLISVLFIFLYIFMPNTRIKFVPAIIAGIFTGVVYQFLQWLYFYFQIGVSSYNAIYGTFAALPLFLVWVHLSWVVTLLGAKLCFAIQNVDAYEFISENEALSHKTRSITALRITHLCVKQFANEKPPLTGIEISNELSIPLLLTKQMLHELVIAEVLTEIKREDQEEAFQPARNIERLTIKHVLDMINGAGNTIPIAQSQDSTLILKNLEKINEAIEKSDGNVQLKNI